MICDDKSSLNKVKILFLCLFLLGAGIRAIDVWRPVDGSVRESYRECDTASIARNYYREGMNLFYPRIDWRGDGPGYAEMEFPLNPWFIAVFYKIFGFHEVIGRLLAYVFSLITMVVIFKLARYLLSESGAMAASLFFVLSPLVIRISDSLQPEGLMFLCYVLAGYTFIRWIGENSWTYYILAMLATSLCILAKASSAHIGLFFVAVLLREKGGVVFRDFRVWIFGFVSLLPACLWYLQAHNFWLTYGNSLGVSNEYHWVGLDLFTNLSIIKGIIKHELLFVWMPPALVLAAYAVYRQKVLRSVEYSLYWLASVFIFYLIAARTSGNPYASYYHIFSVLPATLLFGAGVEAISSLKLDRKFIIKIIIISAVFASIIIGVANFEIFRPNRLIKFILWFGLSALLALVPLVKQFFYSETASSKKLPMGFDALTSYFLLFFLPSTFLYQAFRITSDIHPDNYRGLYQCAMIFRPYIAENVLIVASGGPRVNYTGRPAATNAPYMFYWVDRKGFNVHHEDQSIETIRSLIKRGARYFIAEKGALRTKPAFEYELRREFKLIKECDEALLFDLTPD